MKSYDLNHSGFLQSVVKKNILYCDTKNFLVFVKGYNMGKIKEPIEQFINKLTEHGILEVIGDGISIQDTDFKILYENTVHKDLIGDHVEEFCYKAYQQRNNVCEGCPLTATFKDGKIHTKERSATINNEMRYLEITASPVRDSDGQIVAGIEVVRDVTERKKIEELLRESEEKFRLLFSTEQDAVVIVDGETRKIMDANDSALRLYGYSREEILKLKGPDLSAEPEKSDVAIREIAMGPDKKIHYHARNHKKKDGTVFPVEISSGTFMLKGRKIISAVFRDISERKMSEESIKERVKELEKFYEIAIGRELKMKELKDEIEELKSAASQSNKTSENN